MNQNVIHSFNRWLLIRNGAVGDTILLSSVLQAIRAHTPYAYIEMMGNLERMELLVGGGLANHAVSFEQPGIETLFADNVTLPQHLQDYFSRFDVIIYYGQSNAERIESKLRTNARQIVITHPALPANDDVHITKHYLQAIQKIMDIHQGWIPKISLRDNEVAWGKAWLKTHVENGDNHYVAGIHVGAGSKAKQAPFEVFHQKMDEIKMKHNPLIILPKGPSDEEAVDAFLTSLTDSIPFIIAEGLRLRELAAVLSNCNEFFGNDSGITHLAAALGIPTTAVFVSGNPMVWQPLGGHVKIKYE